MIRVLYKFIYFYYCLCMNIQKSTTLHYLDSTSYEQNPHAVLLCKIHRTSSSSFCCCFFFVEDDGAFVQTMFSLSSLVSISSSSSSRLRFFVELSFFFLTFSFSSSWAWRQVDSSPSSNTNETVFSPISRSILSLREDTPL